MAQQSEVTQMRQSELGCYVNWITRWKSRRPDLTPVRASYALGLYVCGGRGRHSRKTPSELLALGDKLGLPADAWVRSSRLIAKVDGAAVQDGFELYLHGFVAAADGSYCVVQQGMSAQQRTARRYHWLSEGLHSFVDAPHAAIDGPNQGVIVNLADKRAQRSRAAQRSSS